MRYVVLAGLISTALFGCGGGGGGATSTTDHSAALAELGEALKTTAADGKKPPTKLADFDQVEPMTPIAGPLVRSGELVYVWGAGFEKGGTKVVAFEKKAEAEGGLVLIQDGSVKRMTAEDLKAAPRAGSAGTAGKK